MLAEENCNDVKIRSNGKGISNVSVVDGRIVTTEIYKQETTLHVAAVLPNMNKDIWERLVGEAAMRESGNYNYSLRAVNQVLLVQISAYGLKADDDLENELSRLYAKLTETLKRYQFQY